MNTPDTELRFKITGMDCASCARSIEKGVAALPKVEEATINFTTATLRVAGAAAPERIVARVRELGYDVAVGEGEKRRKGEGEKGRRGEGESVINDTSSQKSSGLFSYLWNRSDTRLALLAALLVIPGILFDELLPGLGIESPVFAAMSVLAMLIAGYPIARSALIGLRVNREITINLLMANRDPAAWENPDVFDLDRPASGKSHLTFGFGSHMCPGMHLARLEMTVALNELLDRIGGITWDPAAGRPEFTGVGSRAISHTRVVLSA